MLLLWIKAFHIIAVVCWFAVLFYLPRLFVYHVMADDDTGKERFKVMERKLFKGIGNPSMIATLVLGGALVSFNWEYYKTVGWFHTKMLLVFLLVGYHHVCGSYMKKLANGTFTKSHVFLRWFNEIPVVFLIVVVILVVVRPF